MSPRRARRRGPAVLLALALVTSCSRGGDEPGPGPTSPATTPTPRPPASDGPRPTPGADRGPADPAAHAHLSAWRGCRGRYQCATLTVPRDWFEVDGETLDLAVVRRPASGDRIGSLLLNPGGPGASGVDFLAGFRSLPDGLDERFDVVSWDPRGTGASEPIDCTSDEDLLEVEADPTPDDEAAVAALRAEAEEGLEICLSTAGDLLLRVGTRATVRDLDALRGALGDDALTYVGYSYGTTIGLEYLRMFPRRVRAMVLDGVSMPGVDPVEDARIQAQGFEDTLDAYLDDCAQRASCPLGDDPRATLLGLVERLEADPIPASYTLDGSGAEPREGDLGAGEMYIGVAASLYSRQGWARLDEALAEALAPEPSGRTLLYLRDSYLGREADGTWGDTHDARGAIRCADQADRADRPEGDLSRVDRWGGELPFWGRWFAVGLPGCWGIPDAVEPLAPLESGELADVPPVVIVGSTDDPATPYGQAEEARDLVPGSVLVTYVGAEHTAYRSLTDCVDGPVTRYLVELVLPVDGLRCPA